MNEAAHQRKIKIMITVKRVTFRGVPCLITFFKDMSDAFNEFELQSRFTTVNYILRSKEYQSS